MTHHVSEIWCFATYNIAQRFRICFSRQLIDSPQTLPPHYIWKVFPTRIAYNHPTTLSRIDMLLETVYSITVWYRGLIDSPRTSRRNIYKTLATSRIACCCDTTNILHENRVRLLSLSFFINTPYIQTNCRAHCSCHTQPFKHWIHICKKMMFLCLYQIQIPNDTNGKQYQCRKT